jgi:hypothetical protein
VASLAALCVIPAWGWLGGGALAGVRKVKTVAADGPLRQLKGCELSLGAMTYISSGFEVGVHRSQGMSPVRGRNGVSLYCFLTSPHLERAGRWECSMSLYVLISSLSLIHHSGNWLLWKGLLRG